MKHLSITLLFSCLVLISSAQTLSPQSWTLRDGRVVTRSLCKVYATNPPQYEYCNDTTDPQGMKGDATLPNGDLIDPVSIHRDSPFQQIVFLMQQNKELSDRLDRLEQKIDSLERRPYLFIDLTGSRRGVYLTNTAGEYELFISPLNPK